MKDDIETSFAPSYVVIYSVLYESFSKFILECHQHGITDYFEKRYKRYPRQIKDEPKILTMYMLSAGFYVWLGSVAIAFLTFVGEHVVKYYTNRKNKREQVEEQPS